MLHLWEFLEESRLHRPVLEVVCVLEENSRHFISVVLRIKGKDISIREGPVEVEVLDKRSTEHPRRGVLLMLKHQPIAQTWPD